MAQELPISLEITSDSSAARKDLTQLEGDLNKLGATGQQAGTAIQSQATATQQGAQAADTYGKSAAEAAQATNQLQGSLNSAAGASRQTSEAFSRQAAATQHGTQAMNAHGRSAAQTAQAMSQLPMQMTDVVTSLASGMPLWMVLVQQGGQIKDSFGGIGPALRSIASLFTVTRVAAGGALAALAGVALAYKKGSEEADAYNRALIMSGNAAGSTAGQLQQMAKGIDQVVGTQAKAAEALAAMASTGQVGAENLQQFSQAAIELERTVGQSVEETAKNFAELGKAPLAATLNLDQQLNYLTVSVYEQIKALMEEGRATDAAEVAQKAYAEAMAKRAKQIEGNLGSIERGWRAIKAATLEAADAALEVGRPQTKQEQLAILEKQFKERVERNQTLGIKPGKATQDLQSQIAVLRNQIAVEDAQARNEAQAKKNKDAYLAADKANKKWADAALTTQEKINQALTEYRRNNEALKAGGKVLDPKQVAAEEAAIRSSFTKGRGKNPALTAARAEAGVAMAQLKADLSLLQASVRERDAVIEQALKDGTITLESAYQERLDLLQQESEAERKILQSELLEVNKALAKAKTSAEKGPLEQKKIQIEAQVKLLDSNLAEQQRRLGIWKTDQERQLATITAKVRVEVAQLTGQFDRDAVQAQLKAQFEGDYKAAGQLDDPAEQAAARARIDMLVQAGVAQAGFNARLTEAQRLQSALGVQEEAIRVQATQGAISQAEAEARISQARAAQVPALQAVVTELKAMRDAMPPEAAAAIDQMSSSIGQLQNTAAAATPTVVELGTQLKNSAIDSLANAVGQAATNFQSLRSIVSATLRQVAGDILRSGIKKALTDAFTPNASGGGNLLATAVTVGKSFFGFADGGQIRGPGTGTSDSIPALVDGRMPIAVSNGEFIQPDRAVRHYGLGFMEAVRTLQFPKPRFAFGGLVSAHQKARYATGGLVAPAVSGGGTNVVIQVVNQGTPQRVVEQSQQINGRDTVVSVVLDDLQRGGPISRGIAATQQRR